MDLLVVEKSSQLTFISRFLQNSHDPRTPDFNVGISKHESIIFFTRGGKFDRKKVRNQNPCCVFPTLKSGGAGLSLVTETYVSIVSRV